MKGLHNYIKLYFFGIVLAAISSFLTHCPEDNPTAPIDNPGQETEQVKKFNNDVISAFQSGNKQSVLDLMYDEYKEIYSEELETTPDKMEIFANALKNRKLIFANEMYAEYEVTIDGQIFTITYSNSGEGNWKLHRF